MRRGCARSGALFCGCIGRGCQDILGKRRGRKAQQGGGPFRDLAGVCRLRRPGRCGEGSRESGKSRGVLGSGGRGLRRRVRRSTPGGGGGEGEGQVGYGWRSEKRRIGRRGVGRGRRRYLGVCLYSGGLRWDRSQRIWRL